MNFPLDANDEKIKKSIKKRDDESFVITYELLKDQKFRQERAGDTLKELKRNTLPSVILTKISNDTLGEANKPPSSEFPYGRRYSSGDAGSRSPLRFWPR